MAILTLRPQGAALGGGVGAAVAEAESLAGAA